jgi:membrane protein EpsK
MSNWIAINQIGALLYLNVGLIIINLFLGSAQCGRYAVIALWGTLLASMGGTISNIFAPIAFEYIAHNKIDILALQMQRSTKFLGLIMALPVGLMCGLSVPILKRWLGPSFVDLEPLVWLITIPWLVNIAINPIFAIYRGLNKLKIPAIITLVGGIMNVVLAILLIRYTSLGIYGVAIALVLCLSAKNLFFTPIYAAIVTGQSKITFIKGIITGLIITSILSLISLVISRMYDLASIPRLLITATIISAVYVPLCYGIIINKEDRLLLRSLIRRQKQPYGK